MSIKEKILREQKALKVLAELKDEVEACLKFFIESDIKIYGFIKKGTVEVFKVQGVEFPELLIKFVK